MLRKNSANVDIVSKQSRESTLKSLVAIVALLLIFVCLPVSFGAGYLVIMRLGETELAFLLGVIVSMGIVVVACLCFSGFIVAYSTLRRKEDAEDDKRELDMLRAVSGMRSNQHLTMKMPDGYQSGGWPQLQAQQKPPMQWTEIKDVVIE